MTIWCKKVYYKFLSKNPFMRAVENLSLEVDKIAKTLNK